MKRPAASRRVSQDYRPLLPVSLCFAAGSVLAVFLYGKGGDYLSFLPIWTKSGSFLPAFSSCALWLTVACLAASSVFGGALIPAVSLLCGGTVSYQSVAVMSAGVRPVVTSVIIPALLIVPPFICVACNGINFSGAILSHAEPRLRAAAARRLARACITAYILVLCAAAYICFLLPDIT